MSENAAEKILDLPRDRNKDGSKVFDYLAFAERFEDIDEKMIKKFVDERVREDRREVLEAAAEDEMLALVVVELLPKEEFLKLRTMAIGGDCILPGIHDIRKVFARLLFLTGDDKYKISRQNPGEPDNIIKLKQF